ncbi:hypothetical protein C369_05444 [Cryptococcus neoformans A5-35-17]|nr:hypothetical protein C369_05444 [Cryptococcus neoformans var. grubii A5-35-17]
MGKRRKERENKREYEKDNVKEGEKGMKVVDEGSDGVADGTRVQG